MNSLDKFDLAILGELQANARLTNAELAQRVGLSAAPCWRRVRALEEAGIIAGYHAQINAKALGKSLTALVYISMDKHTPERFAHFEKEIQKIEEIEECLLITGQDADYQLKLCVRDMDEFQELLLNRINQITGVTGVHSSFVLRDVIAKR